MADNNLPDLPEISDDQFVPWTDADRAADFGDLLGTPDTRIPADHPAIPYMVGFSSFYVGRCVIEDGADAVFSFAMGYVDAAKITAYQREAVAMLTNAAIDESVPAVLQSGDSPGSDTWVYVGLSGDRYIGAYNNEHESDEHDTYIDLYDDFGNPIGDGGPQLVNTKRRPEALAAHIALFYKKYR
jgi:hypothetical protein